MSKIPKVREYISEQDSATVLDYMVNELGFPKDIHKQYSEKIAPMPINFGKIEGDKDVTMFGEYTRTPIVSLPFEGAHGAIDTLIADNWVGGGSSMPYTSHIRIDSTRVPKMTQLGETAEGNIDTLMNTPFYSDWQNTLIHEALGHGLLDKMSGYKPKGHSEGILSGRGELLPKLLQAISTQARGYEDKEIEENVIKLLEPIVKSKLKEARGGAFKNLINTVKEYFGY